MSPTQSPARTRSRSRAPALRLLHGHGSPHPEPLRGRDAPAPALRVVDRPTRVLLAGADAGRRATLLDELSRTLPANTVFEQAGAVCDVLEHAPGSRMAFITGDLDDAPAESLLQTLAHRHPELPVLVVDGRGADDGGHFNHHDELRLRHG
jgi:uncharacterized protein (DUF779 family)